MEGNNNNRGLCVSVYAPGRKSSLVISVPFRSLFLISPTTRVCFSSGITRGIIPLQCTYLAAWMNKDLWKPELAECSHYNELQTFC